ncbi:MAG: type VI secretion system-associated protein TagF [Burkholderiaceae bacterium]
MSKPPVMEPPLPGWFGKIPNLGDFALRRLPDDFVRPWDDWLHDGMAQLRAASGAPWSAAYLVAPILRFWIAPGRLGDRGWAGLLMPSVDRVGRYYPLTITRPLDALADALAASHWFAALDATARQALDEGFTAGDLEAGLQALPPLEPVSACDAESRALANRLLARCANPGTASVWWRDDAGAGFHCFEGLPSAAAFATMIGSTP